MKGTLLLFIALCLAVSISARSESLARLVKKWQPEETKGTRKEFGRKCYALTCAKSNKDCGFLDMGNDVHSTGCHDYFGESCNVTESGEGYAIGVCLSTLSAGARCNNENDRCAPGTSCQFSESVPAPGDDIYTCQNEGVTNSTANPGESCGAFINCRYNNVGSFSTASECINGVCKFLANGETCTSGQCHSILSYCDFTATTPICRPLSAVNAACNTSSAVSNQCQRDLLCNPTSILNFEGECIEEYSIKEGKPCKSDNACKDGYCENKLHQAHFFGVCKDYRKTSTIGKKCADDNDCTSNNGESCVCNLDGESKCTNYNFDREQYKTISEYEDCEQDVRNNCGSSLNDEAYTKCVYDACKKPVCKLYKDGKKHTGSYTSGNQACMLVQMCDASGLSLSLPLLAIVAVFVMLFQ